VEDRDGEPLGSAAAAREAEDLGLQFHDGALRARVTNDEEAP
jgi:exonuclease VII large subunit